MNGMNEQKSDSELLQIAYSPKKQQNVPPKTPRAKSPRPKSCRPKSPNRMIMANTVIAAVEKAKREAYNDAQKYSSVSYPDVGIQQLWQKHNMKVQEQL